MRTIVFALVGMFATAAHADCTCECVNGRAQALCQNAYDVRPVCMAMVCAGTLPTAPTPPTSAVAPLPGTSYCAPARVCDVLGNCRTQTVCR